MMIENLLSDRELDKIADKVLERVTIKADISEIIKAFDEIEKRLDDFMR